MAYAVKLVRRTRMVSEHIPDEVRLMLTIPEAETLMQVLRAIGGNRKKSGRRYTEAIADALQVRHIVPALHSMKDSSLWFDDFPTEDNDG